MTHKKRFVCRKAGPIKIKQRTQLGCACASASIECIPLFHCFIGNRQPRCRRVRLIQLLCMHSVSISISSKILIGSAQLLLLFYYFNAPKVPNTHNSCDLSYAAKCTCMRNYTHTHCVCVT